MKPMGYRKDPHFKRMDKQTADRIVEIHNKYRWKLPTILNFLEVRPKDWQRYANKNGIELNAGWSIANIWTT